MKAMSVPFWLPVTSSSLQSALKGERVGNLKVNKLDVWKQAVRIYLKQETERQTYIIDILPQISGKGGTKWELWRWFCDFSLDVTD